MSKSNERTVYMGAAIVPEGYNGSYALVHLCLEWDGAVLAVHAGGYYCIALPDQPMPPFVELPVYDF